MVSLYAVTFQNVRINCTLSKEVDVIKLTSFFVKHNYKLSADYLTLCFRVINTCKLVEETVCSIDVYKVSIKLITKNFNNLFTFSLTHQTMVYMHAKQLLADCFDKKCRNNR